MEALRWGWGVFNRGVRRALGLPVKVDTPDRRVLEGQILPHYAAREDVRELLFVGTRWYTEPYEQLFARQRYVTLEIDPDAARWGSRTEHVTGSVADVAQLFAPQRFDLVVFNGVFGWGLNERAEVERAVQGFQQVLRPSGELVVGWNDIAPRRPFPFGEVRALEGFERFPFEPLGAPVWQHPGGTRHRFEFFRRRLASRSTGT